MAESLTSVEGTFSIKVSSTLNKDVKQFGKKFMFDGKNDTCWNSDQGLPQYVAVEFTEPVIVKELRIRFQGGFASKDCLLLHAANGGHDGFQLTHRFYPEDTNSLQSFLILSDNMATTYKLVFESSTDFYGRIIIYNLELIGDKYSN